MFYLDEKSIKKVIQYIYDYSCENGYPPTQKEIGYQIGIVAPASIHKQLYYLIEKGYIQQSPSTMRTIELKQKSYDLIGVKKEDDNNNNVGESLVLNNSNEYYPLPRHIKYNYPLDSLTLHKVEETNLVHLGVCYGDVILISTSTRPEAGDMFMLKVNDQEYCRKLTSRNRSHISLQPSIEKVDYFAKNKIEILGKMISLYRQY
ncbi:S24 family peptidase [Bacillus sp. Au-Bac7]|uniref:LexA family protein n=1 Tax=Bacillus sp. Au-Bac7 TaxID=2906458 RepID=UPI001E4736A8|nr:S24 family peptidase [Bacillus sp. Au-Bac7]MCE4051661.1 hypothetical protein [Bacillus sp. Au-Bac7]